jgi:hypothetical protein
MEVTTFSRDFFRKVATFSRELGFSERLECVDGHGCGGV